MPRECLVSELRKSALHAQRDARTVKQHRGLEAFALQPQRLKHIDEPDRAFESDGMKGNERLLAGGCLDVLENLFLVIDQIVTLLVSNRSDCRHVLLRASDAADWHGTAIWLRICKGCAKATNA